MVGGVRGASKRRPDAVRTQAVIVSSRQRIGRRRRANGESESHATSKRTRIGAKSQLDPPASVIAADAVRDSVWHFCRQMDGWKSNVGGLIPFPFSKSSRGNFNKATVIWVPRFMNKGPSTDI
ncbi:uncharacterized protein LOC120294584 [Eucalyptus grandis]|uniref:uncharacterized protein LOC120294584 n=1 Tax=Eucalyptus grandis TaxID=71139 RepID=UPI00192EC641|nr:uncharacterized protein LOC120294584 [Eucalyptus grandis]